MSPKQAFDFMDRTLISVTYFGGGWRISFAGAKIDADQQLALLEHTVHVPYPSAMEALQAAQQVLNGEKSD